MEEIKKDKYYDPWEDTPVQATAIIVLGIIVLMLLPSSIDTLLTNIFVPELEVLNLLKDININ